MPASFLLYLNSLSPRRQLDARHLKHIRGVPRRNYRLTSPWKEHHGLLQQHAILPNQFDSGIWQLLADSVHFHHIPTDPILVCNSHAMVPMRTIISRKINFVCKNLKIFPLTYKSHVMNQGACRWRLPTPRIKSKNKAPLVPQRLVCKLAHCSQGQILPLHLIAPSLAPTPQGA